MSAPQQPPVPRDPSQIWDALKILYPNATSQQELAIAAYDAAEIAKADALRLNAEIAKKKKHQVLPKPPVFDGDREQYQVWKAKMVSKLEVDGDVIGQDDRACVLYVSAFLSDEAAKYLKHHTDRNGTATTIASVWEYLDARYQDVHRVQRALAEHERFKQGGKPFPEFIAELNRLQSEAAIDVWTDPVKIQIPKSKVSSELTQLAVANTSMAGVTDYSQVVSFYNQLHNNLVAAKDSGAYRYDIGGPRKDSKTAFKSFQTAPSVMQHTSVASATKDGAEMDWIATNKATTGGNGNRGRSGPDKRPRPAPISEAERDLRQKKGVCFNCGNPGHLARNCYYGRPFTKDAVRVNNVMTSPPEIMVHEGSGAEAEVLPTYNEQLKE